MAGGLDLSIVLRLVDKASAPALAAIGRMRGGAGDAAGAVGGVGAAATGALASSARRVVAMVGGVIAVKAAVEKTVGAAMSFEDAMSEVAKVSGLSGEALKRQGDQIRELSRHVPVAASELARLTAASWQYGIAAEDIDRFTMLAAKASVAFGMSAEQSGESLAKLKASYGLTVDQVGELGDVINHLADTMPTDEANVVDFLLRAGATASALGISAREAAAFGATLSSIGIESQRAATAFNAMNAKMVAIGSDPAAQKALDRIGGRGTAMALQKKFFREPMAALTDLFKLSRQMDKETRAGFFVDFFGLEYQDDATAISEHLDELVAKVAELEDTGRYVGSLDRTFEAFSETTRNRLKQLGNILTDWGIGIGERVVGPLNAFVAELNTLFNTLGNRQTVFDDLAVSINGFFAGLGFDGASGALKDFLTTVRDVLFGEEIGGRQAGENLARLFQRFREYGAAVRAFGDDVAAVLAPVGDFFAAMAEFVGVDSEAAGAVLASVGSAGITIGVGAVGIGLAAAAIGKLGSALFVLSGLKAGVAVLRGIAGLGGSLAGALGAGGAMAGAGAGAAGAGAAGAAGGKGRLGGALGFLATNPAALVAEGGAILSYLNAEALRRSPELRKALLDNPMLGAMSGDAALAAGIMDAPDTAAPADAGPVGWMIDRWNRPPAPDEGELAVAEAGREALRAAALGDDPATRRRRRRAPGGVLPEDVAAAGTGGAARVAVDGAVRTEPTGIQDVRLTNPPAPANVSVVVNVQSGASPAAIGAAAGNAVADVLAARADADLSGAM